MSVLQRNTGPFLTEHDHIAAVETRTTIALRGLPKTAIPADIRRLCVKGKVESIANGASWLPRAEYKGLT